MTLLKCQPFMTVASQDQDSLCAQAAGRGLDFERDRHSVIQAGTQRAHMAAQPVSRVQFFQQQVRLVHLPGIVGKADPEALTVDFQTLLELEFAQRIEKMSPRLMTG